MTTVPRALVDELIAIDDGLIGQEISLRRMKQAHDMWKSGVPLIATHPTHLPNQTTADAFPTLTAEDAAMYPVYLEKVYLPRLRRREELLAMVKGER